MWDKSCEFWDNEGKQAAMAFWGWRQGACAVFISVLVTACIPTHNAPQQTASPTPFTITLTVVKPPGPTPTPRVPRLVTVTPAQNAALLEVYPARCEELLSGGFQCVGQLYNTDTQAVGWVVIHADSGEDAPRSRTALEQLVIPAGTNAPYRLVLSHPADTISLQVESQVITREWVALEVMTSQGEDTPDGYRITAQVTNPTPRSIYDGRAVVMMSEGEMLLGYRVIDVPSLAGGESTLITTMWAGEIPPNFRYSISAIGWVSVG